MKDHKKHGKTVRPAGGKFHRNEIAILGAPCSTIRTLTSSLASELQPTFSSAYVDASHDETAWESPFQVNLMSHIDHNRVGASNHGMELRMRKALNDADLAFINGNHFKAEHQIVIINEKKRESLSRKLDRLTNVLMIVIDDGMEEPHDFLKEHIANAPIFRIAQVEQIAELIKSVFSTKADDLFGLVLAGGKSLRMGHDKGAIDYHGKAQREHAADLLALVTHKTFMSVRELNTTFDTEYDKIPDSFLDLGPFGGILSAFRQFPDHAWLTVATDIPRLNKELIDELVNRRNRSKMATCFYNPATKFPEPLITIWEPRAYHHMLEFLGNGLSCPRKVLINSDVEMIDEPRFYDDLVNVNTPEELKAVAIK